MSWLLYYLASKNYRAQFSSSLNGTKLSFHVWRQHLARFEPMTSWCHNVRSTNVLQPPFMLQRTYLRCNLFLTCGRLEGTAGAPKCLKFPIFRVGQVRTANYLRKRSASSWDRTHNPRTRGNSTSWYIQAHNFSSLNLEFFDFWYFQEKSFLILSLENEICTWSYFLPGHK